MNPAEPVRQLRPANRADRPLLDQRQPPFDLLDHAESRSNRAWIDTENSHGRDCNCRARIKGLRFTRRRGGVSLLFSAPPRALGEPSPSCYLQNRTKRQLGRRLQNATGVDGLDRLPHRNRTLRPIGRRATEQEPSVQQERKPWPPVFKR